MEALATNEFEMRRPCPACSCEHGYSADKSGQEVVYCLHCDGYQYCRPKTESGRAQRTVRTRPSIPPKQRFRVLEQFGHACASCGAADQILHVGHLIPVDAWQRWGEDIGMTETELWADENLCALCEECNLGMGNTLASVRLMLRVQRLRRAQRP